jgi:hypothetical protein
LKKLSGISNLAAGGNSTGNIFNGLQQLNSLHPGSVPLFINNNQNGQGKVNGIGQGNGNGSGQGNQWGQGKGNGIGQNKQWGQGNGNGIGQNNQSSRGKQKGLKNQNQNDYNFPFVISDEMGAKEESRALEEETRIKKEIEKEQKLGRKIRQSNAEIARHEAFVRGEINKINQNNAKQGGGKNIKAEDYTKRAAITASGVLIIAASVVAGLLVGPALFPLAIIGVVSILYGAFSGKSEDKNNSPKVKQLFQLDKAPSQSVGLGMGYDKTSASAAKTNPATAVPNLNITQSSDKTAGQTKQERLLYANQNQPVNAGVLVPSQSR